MKRIGCFLFVIMVLGAACPPPVYTTINVCAETGLLPTPYCPNVEPRLFKIGLQPTAVCQKHTQRLVSVCADTGHRAVAGCQNTGLVPEAEASAFSCRRHIRKAGGPLFVLAWLDGQCKIHRFSDDELDAFARRLGEAGVDYVRLFFPGWEDWHPDGSRFPYEQEADGRWNLDRPNPGYDENLSRLAAALGRYEVGIYMDMADQCGIGYPWDLWGYNANGIRGWWDESAEAFAAWRSAAHRVLAAIGGSEGHIIGLGNELQHPDDAGFPAPEWPLAWGKPRIDHLLELGIPRPITFSGGGRTAHKLMGYLSAEDGYYPGYDYLAQVIHGISWTGSVPPGEASVEDWLLSDFSIVRYYGYSDDGGDCHLWNKLPLDRRGSANKGGAIWGANAQTRVEVVELFYRTFGDRLVVVEFLPREISDDQQLTELAEDTLEAFRRAGLEVFGVDIRRTFGRSN